MRFRKKEGLQRNFEVQNLSYYYERARDKLITQL